MALDNWHANLKSCCVQACTAMGSAVTNLTSQKSLESYEMPLYCELSGLKKTPTLADLRILCVCISVGSQIDLSMKEVAFMESACSRWSQQLSNPSQTFLSPTMQH